jgi:threonine dehydratase
MTIDRQAIAAAAHRIAPFIRRTPVMDVNIPGVEKSVSLKLELFQHAGSFKPRGAFNNLAGARIPAAGITAASGGNHGAAVAYAAKVMNVPARIFVPAISSPAKVARISGYGAAVVQEGANYQESQGLCQAYAGHSGALNIHAYNTEKTIIGQGTLGQELEEQCPDLDTVIIAVGGGGLIAGVASWYQSKIKVVGVEPRTCNALHAALAAGEPTLIRPAGLAADSLGASSAGTLMFPIAQEHVAEVVLIEDEDIKAAQRFLWTQAQIVTEPGGAAAFASLLAGSYKPEKNERVGVIVCGANTPLDVFNATVTTA